MNRFWIFLAVVVVGLGVLFVATKPKDEGPSAFTGDAATIQKDDHARYGTSNNVTLIEYADLQCPACGAYHPVMQQLSTLYKDKVNFIFRHYPIISAHPNAFSAARAAESASNQGKFWEMHDRLFETQSTWGQVTKNQQSLFENYAKDLGLDMEKFKQDYASEATADRINRDVSSAKQFDITGTPTFVLNGKKIDTPGGLDGFKKILDDAIAEAEKSAQTPEAQ